MSRRRPRVESYMVQESNASNVRPYVHGDKTSFWGPVITANGIVFALSDALNDMCRYDVVAGGRQYIYYEDGTRTVRGLARQSGIFARDAALRARRGMR